MRLLLPFLLALACALPAAAQGPRLKLDSLGLPPFPGANSVGNIRLPLGAILKPEPGQTPTGPKLSDLAIHTYRTPLKVEPDLIIEHYLKFAADAGWVLLDDIPDSPATRALVFWSKSAPGYLTVEVGPGPEETRQIDLTRLLGEVDPLRPGEILKFTGKNVRPQRVEATYTGRFLNIATNKFERRTLRAVETRSETGLGVEAVRWIAPEGETYDAAWTVTDLHGRLTKAEAYAGNGTRLTEASAPGPVKKLVLKGKIRGGQNMATRVVIWGHLPQPETPAPGATETKREPTILTEWYGLRPPRTAFLELRRGPNTKKTEKLPPQEPVDLGPSCDGPLLKTLEWTSATTEKFDFPEDLFGTLFPRPSTEEQKGDVTVGFPQGSGRSNVYTLIPTANITESKVTWGYGFHGAWVNLPSKRPNPVDGSHTLTVVGAPTVEKTSSGPCDTGD